MKKMVLVLIIIVVIVLGIAVLKDALIKSIVTVTASAVTGAPVHIDGFSLGIFAQSVEITGFRMGNPKGFPDGTLIDLPKVTVACDVAALLKGKLHLRLVDVDLKEIGLIKNQEGKLNVDSLKVAEQPQAKQPQGKPAKPLPMQIDLLNVQMGKLVMKDYSAGKEPSVQVYDINLKKSYKNITSAQQLAALLLAEPMKQAGIKGAKLYGVALLAGVAVLPVAVVATFVGKDSVEKELGIASGDLYAISLDVLKRMGKVDREDKSAGVIDASVSGANVNLKLRPVSAKSTKITISARKYLLPKPEIANGVLYEISRKIK